MTVVDALVALHPLPSVTVTLYTPASFAEILCVVAPVLHRYVYPAGALNTTLSPKQNVVVPLALTVATGKAFATTDVALL